MHGAAGIAWGHAGGAPRGWLCPAPREGSTRTGWWWAARGGVLGEAPLVTPGGQHRGCCRACGMTCGCTVPHRGCTAGTGLWVPDPLLLHTRPEPLVEALCRNPTETLLQCLGGARDLRGDPGLTAPHSPTCSPWGLTAMLTATFCLSQGHGPCWSCWRCTRTVHPWTARAGQSQRASTKPAAPTSKPAPAPVPTTQRAGGLAPGAWGNAEPGIAPL